MAFIIKPLVTEKVTKLTEKTSVARKLRARGQKTIENKNAVEEKITYVVKHKGKPEETKEKSIYTYEKPARPQYAFVVKPEANKIEIKKEVEGLYNVTVLSVNTMRYAGKRSQRYTKAGLVKGQKNAFKKAIVTLKERKLKPVTPGQRHKVIGTFEDITASVPEKSLVYGKRSTGGRNNTGKMTVRYMGGGHKRKYRIIDFKREKDGVPAVVKTIEYDPNRSARIALLFYVDGEKRYIIAPNGLQVGAKLMSGESAAPEIGNALPLANIPVGTVIHNIELRPGQGALLVRSAGNFAQLTSREGDYCVIKLPSGETRKILSACKATVGAVGNSDHALEQSGKAGRSRWLGRRPHNRGVVMNPHDHPMGGGEGRQSGGHPRSRKGLYAKGLKTRAPKKLSNKYIIERANKK